ncbi:MarR family winged helix-turn-helix transcriptional regulator [Paeniglutamicibacter sp. R2-26]|uniref:MarR family winged helix-turn-helix transcriptional regulator n=1 Tax=Paeniglutamicibacter sp. R2-26 TaxID=3144417 RepID=UPI003EE48353
MKSLMGVKQELFVTRLKGGESAQVVMALLATARRIDADCALILSDYELSEGRLAVLLAVSENPGITPAELAARLDVKRATITGLLDGLERQGLVTRAGGATDRRTISVHIADAGELIIETLAPVYSAWLDSLVVGIDARDRAAVVRALTTISGRLGGGMA